MDVNIIIQNFRLFILSAWDTLAFFNENLSADAREESLNNWLQANWELLVETNICKTNEFLEVYGYGADCNGASSRVCYSDKLPTHRVICNPLNDIPVKDEITKEMRVITGMTFDGFMNWDGKYYQISPPFDHVLLTNNENEILVRISEVFFDTEKILE